MLPLATVAGNVADTTGDGLGDNHNDLPGAVPSLVSAGVDQTGGPGSNGIVRIQSEWDITELSTEAITAFVTFFTQKGSIDSLDTSFFVGTDDQDGLLTDSDFAAPAMGLPGVLMPVPDGAPTGIGSFTFDVTSSLNAAVAQGFSFFSIQGRVDERLAGGGPQRGLQVRSTATSNLGSTPTLSVTQGTALPLLWTLTSLPADGTLVGLDGSPVELGPIFSGTTPSVIYRPGPGFEGIDGFSYSVTEGLVTDPAAVTIVVDPETCVEAGRPEDCQPQDGGGFLAPRRQSSRFER